MHTTEKTFFKSGKRQSAIPRSHVYELEKIFLPLSYQVLLISKVKSISLCMPRIRKLEFSNFLWKFILAQSILLPLKLRAITFFKLSNLGHEDSPHFARDIFSLFFNPDTHTHHLSSSRWQKIGNPFFKKKSSYSSIIFLHEKKTGDV